MENEIPKLYHGETDKVFNHRAAASLDTSKETSLYIKNLKQKLEITIIHKSEVPVKSPGVSPMDLFGSGQL